MTITGFFIKNKLKTVFLVDIFLNAASDFTKCGALYFDLSTQDGLLLLLLL
jgi:hypothetical protein